MRINIPLYIFAMVIRIVSILRIRKNHERSIWRTIARKIANCKKSNYWSWIIGQWKYSIHSSIRFHSFKQPSDWSILLPRYLLQGWIDKRISIRTSVPVAALFRPLKIDRTRKERERNFESNYFSNKHFHRLKKKLIDARNIFLFISLFCSI